MRFKLDVDKSFSPVELTVARENSKSAAKKNHFRHCHS